ncbi:hypothetical protein HVPorG_04926 [Roseomonas mucosa]|nr:hypothetical protein HVPorG_04926 [Roseomonas mucosa]
MNAIRARGLFGSFSLPVCPCWLRAGRGPNYPRCLPQRPPRTEN